MSAKQPYPLSASLWAATATSAPATEPLRDTTHADVLVIGAGYAGLSTALHLAERGTAVTVLEARDIGFGGSGRNGGQVIPGLKHDPDELLRRFGPAQGEKLVAFAGRTADTVFDLIARHQMDVPHVRNGWIQAAHNEQGLAAAHKRARQWQAQGTAAARELNRDDVARLLGSDRYVGGWLDARGGAVQPLSYAHGLARAAIAAGARVHTDTPVEGLTRHAGRWQVQTAGGATVTADRVVMCTNAYGGHRTSLWPGLRESLIDANSFQVATEPLPEAIRATILPQGHVSSDTRNLLLYFRLDDAGRLLMGGRGPFREPEGPADWAHLQRAIVKLFPQTAGVPLAYRWCGRVAITRDYLPHLHEPAPGLLINLGCQGRGVGLQTAMGRAMAQYVATGDVGALPLGLTPIRTLPFYGLRRLYVGAVAGWYRLVDGGV